MNTAEELAIDLQAERARTGSLIATAITDLFLGRTLTEVETEPLEALHEWIGAELLDRSVRDTDYLKRVPF